MLLLLLFAFGVRVIGIEDQSIWADEGFTYLTTQQTDLLPMLQSDVHPPLYFAMMRAWVGASGVSELALRYPSALASVISVALVFMLAREMLRLRGQNARESLVPWVGALVFALSDLEVDLSREARMYTLHTALALGVVFSYLRWVRFDRRRHAIAWMLLSAVLVYVNYLGVWTPIVTGLHALLTLRGRRRVMAMGWMLGAAALVMPWLIGVASAQLGNGAGAERSDATTWSTLWVYVQNWLGAQWPLMLGLLVLGIGVWQVERRRPRVDRVSGLLVLWIVVPAALTAAANFAVPVLAAHRLTQITPPIVLLIGFGLAWFRPSAQIFLAGVIFVSGISGVDYARVRGPWEAYTQSTSSLVRAGDLVLMEIAGGDTMLEYYFDRDLPGGASLVSLKRWREGSPDDFARRIDPLVADANVVWLMYWSSEQGVFDVLQRQGLVQTMTRITPHIRDTQLLAYRYDRLPDEPVVEFGDMMLRDVRIYDRLLRVDLWWQAEQPLPTDYTVSAFLLDETGILVAQLDTQPMLSERPTRTWLPGEVIYDPKPLTTVDGEPLKEGSYQVGIVVYEYTPNGLNRLRTSEGEESFIVGTLEIR
jgi:4-amino-4-deoxy-L-arabinose transferase-like glycosyltransferase